MPKKQIQTTQLEANSPDVEYSYTLTEADATIVTDAETHDNKGYSIGTMMLESLVAFLKGVFMNDATSPLVVNAYDAPRGKGTRLTPITDAGKKELAKTRSVLPNAIAEVWHSEASIAVRLAMLDAWCSAFYSGFGVEPGSGNNGKSKKRVPKVFSNTAGYLRKAVSAGACLDAIKTAGALENLCAVINGRVERPETLGEKLDKRLAKEDDTATQLAYVVERMLACEPVIGLLFEEWRMPVIAPQIHDLTAGGVPAN